MKKLSFFIIVAALAMFIAIPEASANDFWWERVLIHGEYAFTGSGACTIAPGGFNESFVPNPSQPQPPAPPVSMGANFWAGVYTFNYDGTGKMDAHQVYQDGPSAYDAGAADLSWGFTYEMDGPEITFTFIPGTYSLKYTLGGNTFLTELFPPPQDEAYFTEPWMGRISPDGRTLFVFYGVPMKIIIPEFGGIEIICQGVHQGFKTHY